MLLPRRHMQVLFNTPLPAPPPKHLQNPTNFERDHANTCQRVSLVYPVKKYAGSNVI